MRSPQHQLAVPRQLRFHLFVHLLIRDARAAHFILMLNQNLAHLIVQAVFHSEFFHHALANPLRHRFRRLALDLVSFDEPLYYFRGHMADIIPNEQHSKRVLYPVALSRYKEKQFTGSPGKVQLSAAGVPAIARKKNFARRCNPLTLRAASCTMGCCGRLAQLVRAPALQAGGRRFEPCTAHHLVSFTHTAAPHVTPGHLPGSSGERNALEVVIRSDGKIWGRSSVG